VQQQREDIVEVATPFWSLVLAVNSGQSSPATSSAAAIRNAGPIESRSETARWRSTCSVYAKPATVTVARYSVNAENSPRPCSRTSTIAGGSGVWPARARGHTASALDEHRQPNGILESLVV
jgi:hypothetical protein